MVTIDSGWKRAFPGCLVQNMMQGYLRTMQEMSASICFKVVLNENCTRLDGSIESQMGKTLVVLFAPKNFCNNSLMGGARLRFPEYPGTEIRLIIISRDKYFIYLLFSWIVLSSLNDHYI